MRRAGMLIGLLISIEWLCCGSASAQSPAAPSHVSVVRAIEKLESTLQGPTPGAAEAKPGWDSFLGELKAELETYSKSNTFAERHAALRQLSARSATLAAIGWEPVVEIRTALEAWLQPRLQLAFAADSLHAVIAMQPVSPEDATNRAGWSNFLDTYLAGAFRAYESASTVQARRKALLQFNEALGSIEKAANWSPSLQVASAGRSLIAQPNLDITADPNTLSRYFARELVQTGPVYRKGYISQVTAGPYLGFGLLASDEGIGFYNAQALTSYTPITDFQNQIASDRRGRRVAKIYQFQAASTDASTLTVSTLITPAGLRLWSSATHATDALIGAANQPGKGLQRAVLGLIGFNRNRIVQQVYENGIDRIRQNVDRESAEERAERMAASEASENAKLAAILVGNRTAIIKDLLVTGLQLGSRPHYAWASGNLAWNGSPEILGADAPQPPSMQLLEQGVVADLHVTSILNNLVQGVWKAPLVSGVENLLIETRPPAEGAAPGSGMSVRRNVGFADYAKAVADAKALAQPKAQALWIKKPGTAPSFGIDARGYLIVMIPDLRVDVPIPSNLAAAANNAKILRLSAPNAEIALELELKGGSTPGEPAMLVGAVKEFTPGPGATVQTIVDDETKAATLDRIRSTLVIQGFARTLTAQPIRVPLEGVKIPGYDLASVSRFDPSGWVRVVLRGNGEPVAAPSLAAQPAPSTEAEVVGQ
ncbi:MAG: hypothetical protein SFX72_05370 [Isosphaeraceae bacterium]|nr:hypothetical protein [Isosphaeraceae bacterium]